MSLTKSGYNVVMHCARFDGLMPYSMWVCSLKDNMLDRERPYSPHWPSFHLTFFLSCLLKEVQKFVDGYHASSRTNFHSLMPLHLLKTTPWLNYARAERMAVTLSVLHTLSSWMCINWWFGYYDVVVLFKRHQRENPSPVLSSRGSELDVALRHWQLRAWGSSSSGRCTRLSHVSSTFLLRFR